MELEIHEFGFSGMYLCDSLSLACVTISSHPVVGVAFWNTPTDQYGNASDVITLHGRSKYSITIRMFSVTLVEGKRGLKWSWKLVCGKSFPVNCKQRIQFLLTPSQNGILSYWEYTGRCSLYFCVFVTYTTVIFPIFANEVNRNYSPIQKGIVPQNIRAFQKQ